MADTRVQLEVEDWVRRNWMPEQYGIRFSRERLRLRSGGVFDFDAVSEAIKTAGVEPQAAEISMVPQNYIHLEGADAKTMLKLYDALEDNDDVQKVYANFDIDESEME